jgi:hypothetical protein
MSTLFCCILALSLALNCGPQRVVNSNSTNAIQSNTSASPSQNRETLYYLDLNNPSITQPIQSEIDKPGESKFVQVEVSEVQNPKKLALTFQVHYQAKSGEKINLGSFSLYPPDNPGKFIVATQGKVKDEGAIVLSMSTPDQADKTEPIKVAVSRMRLIKGN